MRSTGWEGRTVRRGWVGLLGRPVSRRAGLRTGLFSIVGLLGALVAGCGEGEEEEDDDD